LEALNDSSQPDSISDPTFCNVFPLVLSSFKDQQCFADIDTPAQPSVRGRLRKRIDSWRSLEVSQLILNVIIQGYKITFFHLPTPFSKVNNASARNNSAFVSEAVNDLLNLNLVEEISCALDITNPLSVSTRSSGKQRLILDLMHVNAFIYKQKFKFEDLSVATQIFDKDYYLFKFDLKSGYHHIEISQSTANTSHLLGILALGSSDTFNFAFFRLAFLLLLLFSPRFSNRFKNPGEVGAFLLPFSWTMV